MIVDPRSCWRDSYILRSRYNIQSTMSTDSDSCTGGGALSEAPLLECIAELPCKHQQAYETYQSACIW